MHTTLLGDIHNKIPIYHYWIAPASEFLPPHSIQLGDLSTTGYKGIEKYNWSEYRYFIDGNHDQHPILPHDSEKPVVVLGNLVYIPRGFQCGNVLFMGGADSIPNDKNRLYPGLRWFPEETITDTQIERALLAKDVEVIISHTAPSSVVKKICKSFKPTPSEEKLQVLFEKLNPKRWFFGHFHQDYKVTYKKCVFQCINTHGRKHVELPMPPLSDFI